VRKTNGRGISRHGNRIRREIGDNWIWKRAESAIYKDQHMTRLGPI